MIKGRVILTFVFLFLVNISNVNAFEFDNSKEYDEETRTATITNAFGLGKEIAKVTLLSPTPLQVGSGDEILVAWYNLENFENYDGSLAFVDIDTYFDEEGNREVFKDFIYKRKTQKTITEKTCSNSKRILTNGSKEINCIDKNKIIEGWEDFDRTANLEPGNYTIGLFTKVVRGETIEWIPTMYGSRIFEWAVWSSDINVDILSYYYMNESSGEERDWVNGQNNITVFAGSTGRGSDGIVNGSANMTHLPTGSYFESNQLTGLNVTNGTITMWINYSVVATLPDENYVLGGLYDTDDTSDYLTIDFQDSDTFREIDIWLVTGGIVRWHLQTNPDFLDFNPPRGEFSHFALRHNGTDPEIFINGSSIWNDTLILNNTNITAWWGDVINGGADVMTWGANRTNGATSPNWNGSFDEIGLWSRALTETEIFDIYNDTLIFEPVDTVTVVNDLPSNNSNLLSDSLIFNGTLTPSGPSGGVTLTNATLLIFNSSGDLINDTVTNTVTGTVANSSGNLTINSISVDTYNWSILGCATNPGGGTVCGVSSNFTFNISRFLINNESFTPQTTEGSTETFEILLNITPTLTFIPHLIYNETDQGTAVRIALGGNSFRVLETINIPSVATPRNKSFFWRLDFSDGFSTNTTNQTQEILQLSLDNCTSNTFQLFHYGMVDEEFQTVIANPEIELAANLFTLNRAELLVNFSQSFNQTPVTICSEIPFPNGTSYSFDSVVKYTAPNYAIEYYNIENQTMNNNTQNQSITLFDLNASDSTDFQIAFTGSDFLPATATLVFLNRQYITENVFKTVELPKTDPNGKVILHMVANDVVYNIILLKGNAIIGTFTDVTAFCPTAALGECQISLVASSELEDFNYNSLVGIIFSTSPLFDTTTNVISFDFVVADGSTKLVSLNVSRDDVFGNRSICTNSLEASSGTLSCTISSSITNTHLATVIYVDGEKVIVSGVDIDRSDFGSAGYLAWFIITLVLVFAFSDSKSGVMFAMLISYVGAVVLGIARGSVIGVGSAGIWIITITVLGIWRLSRERPQ